MVNTIPPECPKLPLKFRFRPAARKMLKMFYDSLVEDLRNSDKASGMDDAAYYEGRIELAGEVIFGLTGKYII